MNLVRQPLLPALSTLLLLICVMLSQADGSGADSAPEASTLLGGLLVRFQMLWPGWARFFAGAALLIAGLQLGRLPIRYSLYTFRTCIGMPLFGVAVGIVALSPAYLAECIAALLFALASKHFCASFRTNGYGFGGSFRAAFCLGLLPLVVPGCEVLWLLIPVAMLLFRRTLRELVVAMAGLILPLLAACYLSWAAGRDISAPLIQLAEAYARPFGPLLLATLPLHALVPPAWLLLLAILSAWSYAADFYVVSTKPRFILLFHVVMLGFCLALFLLPCGTATAAALFAIPAAILLPQLLLRIHGAVASLIYLLLLLAGLSVPFVS